MGPRRRASGGSGRRQLFLLLIALLIALLCFFTLTVDAAAKKKGKGKSSGKKASSKEGGSSGSSDSSEKKIKIPKLKTNLKGLAKCPKAVSRGEDIAPVTSLYLNPPKPNAGSSFTWNATLTVTKVITDGVEMRMRAEKDGKKLSEDVMWVDPASSTGLCPLLKCPVGTGNLVLAVKKPMQTDAKSPTDGTVLLTLQALTSVNQGSEQLFCITFPIQFTKAGDKDSDNEEEDGEDGEDGEEGGEEGAEKRLFGRRAVEQVEEEKVIYVDELFEKYFR